MAGTSSREIYLEKFSGREDQAGVQCPQGR